MQMFSTICLKKIVKFKINVLQIRTWQMLTVLYIRLKYLIYETSIFVWKMNMNFHKRSKLAAIISTSIYYSSMTNGTSQKMLQKENVANAEP